MALAKYYEDNLEIYYERIEAKEDKQKPKEETNFVRINQLNNYKYINGNGGNGKWH